MTSLLDKLRAIAREDQILQNEPMSRHTTFRVGGPADVLFLPEGEEQLIGALETAKATVGEHDNTEFRVIDIQSIPFEDESFDVVIANMMLYHVPDLKLGLREVRRVLKKTGKFYCATYGEHGIVEYMAQKLGRYGVEDQLNKSFTIQNGGTLLGGFFPRVELLEYKDSLAVTNVEDLVDYIYSLNSMTSLASVPRQEILDTLSENVRDGVLSVPKEYGMFVASES